MKIHGKEYTEVKDRIPLLLEKYPGASIETDILWHAPDFNAVCIKATVRTPDTIFTGLAYEERVGGDKEVNATSWVENAETSAIGRALANMNIGVSQARPSAEEMQKVERMKPSGHLDELKMSLGYAVDAKRLDTLEDWKKINAEKLAKLTEPEKKILRGIYHEAETKLKGVQ